MVVAADSVGAGGAMIVGGASGRSECLFKRGTLPLEKGRAPPTAATFPHSGVTVASRFANNLFRAS